MALHRTMKHLEEAVLRATEELKVTEILMLLLPYLLLLVLHDLAQLILDLLPYLGHLKRLLHLILNHGHPNLLETHPFLHQQPLLDVTLDAYPHLPGVLIDHRHLLPQS